MPGHRCRDLGRLRDADVRLGAVLINLMMRRDLSLVLAAFQWWRRFRAAEARVISGSANCRERPE